MERLKKNKLMITTGNNNNSKTIGRNNHYYGPLNQSNSTNNHFLTDNNRKMYSNDKEILEVINCDINKKYNVDSLTQLLDAQLALSDKIRELIK